MKESWTEEKRCELISVARHQRGHRRLTQDGGCTEEGGLVTWQSDSEEEKMKECWEGGENQVDEKKNSGQSYVNMAMKKAWKLDQREVEVNHSLN